MRLFINLVGNIDQSWLHIPSWRRFGLRRLSCSLLSRLLGLWEHGWSQSQCVLAFSKQTWQRWEASVFLNKKASKLGVFQMESIKWMGSKILHYVWRLNIIPIVVVFVLPRWFVTASQWYNQECDIIISKLNFQLSSKSNSPNCSIQDRKKRSSPAKTHGSSLSQPPWRPHPRT